MGDDPVRSRAGAVLRAIPAGPAAALGWLVRKGVNGKHAVAAVLQESSRLRGCSTGQTCVRLTIIVVRAETIVRQITVVRLKTVVRQERSPRRGRQWAQATLSAVVDICRPSLELARPVGARNALQVSIPGARPQPVSVRAWPVSGDCGILAGSYRIPHSRTANRDGTTAAHRWPTDEQRELLKLVRQFVDEQI